MALHAVEVALQQAISTALGQFQADAATLTPALFALWPTAIQAQITQSLGNATTPIPVLLAYPLDTPVLPAVWIRPGPIQESQEVIGEAFGWSGAVDTHGTLSQGSWDCLVAAPNANLILALHTLVRWALFSQRDWLGQHAQLVTQAVGGSPLTPITNSAGDVIFPFQRTTTLSGLVADTWTALTAPTVTQATATVAAE